jgi:hypothetical protein
MAERISILVNRKGPIWLPAVQAVDPETGKRRKVAAKLLPPGASKLSAIRWEQSASHPTIQHYLNEGLIVLEPSDEQRTEHTHAPDSISGLDDLTIAKAKPWIAASEDPSQLEGWRLREQRGKNRSGILDRIDDRLDVLAEYAEG